MGLLNLGKKKSTPLRPLSEDDIQKKLYGESIKSSKDEVDFLQQEFKEPTAVAINPEETQMRQTPPKPSEELFRAHAEPMPVEADEAKRYGKNEIKQKKDYLPKATDKTFLNAGIRHQKPIRQVTVKKADFGKEARSKLRSLKLFLEGAGTGLKRTGSLTGEGLVTLLSWIFQGLHLSLRFLFTHRRVVKQVALWLLGIAVVFVLFSSVHYLNVKRENAIEGSSRVLSAENTPVDSEAGIQNLASEEDGGAMGATTINESAGEVENIAQEGAEGAITTIGLASPNAGRYGVQVATYVAESDAKRISDELSKKGWPAFVKESQRSGGRIYYSVYLGRFNAYDESKEWFSKFKSSADSKPFQDAFIRTFKE